MKTLFISILTSLLLVFSSGYSHANLDIRPIEPSQLQLSSSNPVQPTLSKKQIRQQLKAKRQAAQKQHNRADEMLILSVVFAILIPCVGVLIWQGGISIDFWITLLLMLLFYIPGIIYALYVIFVKG